MPVVLVVDVVMLPVVVSVVLVVSAVLVVFVVPETTKIILRGMTNEGGGTMFYRQKIKGGGTMFYRQKIKGVSAYNTQNTL